MNETSPKTRWLGLAVLMLPVLLISVDNTVLAFALPKISESLAPSGQQLLWIVDVYSLVLAGLLVPMGSFGDRFGRRRMLMIGATGFTLISALAAFSPSAEWLIALRAAMAVFGAMIMPATLSLIRKMFTDATERRTAIAIWAAAFSGGAALGPIVGGALLNHFFWGSVFLMAVPVMIPLLILAPLCLPESRDPDPSPIDPVSIVLILGAMIGIVFAIKSLADGGITVAPVVVLVVGLAMGVVFVRRQLRRRQPMVDVRLFRISAFSGAVSANLLSIFSMVGFIYFVSQHLQLVSGYSPMQSGLMLLPGLALTIITGLTASRVAQRLPASWVVAGGLLLNAAGFALAAATGRHSSDLLLMTAFALVGAGVGFAETISNDLILSTAPAEKSGAASAISETAYEVGAVLGTAVLGSIVNAAYRAHVSLPAGLSAAQAETAGDTLAGAEGVAAHLASGTGAQLRESAQAAFDTGVTYTGGIGAVLMVIAALIAVRTLRGAR